jgi:hypothetical protein
MPPHSIDVANRLKRGNKTRAKNHQEPNQNNGWVMADSSLDKTNINNLNQNEKHMFGQIDRFILDTPDTPAVVDGVVTANRLLQCKTSSAFVNSPKLKTI